MTPSPKKKKKLLLYVHGLYGSNLTRKKSNNAYYLGFLSHWSIIRNVLFRGNRGHEEISLPIKWYQNNQNQEKLKEDGWQPTSLMEMGGAKGWIDYWEKRRRSRDGGEDEEVEIRNFLWDWRRPIEEASELFEEWILAQNGLDPENPAMLVTFSAGSLLAWPTLNKYPQLFSGWVSVAAAIGSGNLFLKDLTSGWYEGPICLLRPETNFAFPSHYAFFPADKEPIDDTIKFVVDNNTFEEKKVGNMFDIQTWKENRLGIYAVKDELGKEVTPDEETNLIKTLESCSRFRKKHFVRGEGVSSFDDPSFLAHDKSKYYHLEIVVFGSDDSHETHSGWIHDGKMIRTDLGSVASSGDGTICSWAWKVVPGGLAHRVVFASSSTYVHSNIMADPRLHQTVAELLNLEDATTTGTDERKERNFQLSTWISAAGIVIMSGLFLRRGSIRPA